jgi:uncharacterized membrane protein
VHYSFLIPYNYMNILTMGVYESHRDAEEAIEELEAFGIKTDDISCMYSDSNGKVKDAQTGEKSGAGAAAGATAGAVVGAIAGLVVANGILPGIGTFFVAGPLAAALGLTGAAATTVAGAATGAAAGGLIGALTNLGIDEADAKLYEDFVRRGDVLVIARSESDKTKDVFLRTNAAEIREYTM